MEEATGSNPVWSTDTSNFVIFAVDKHFHGCGIILCMKKVLFYILLGIVLVFGLLLYVGWRASQSNDIKLSSEDDCVKMYAPGISGDLGRDYCNYDLAQKNNDPTFCAKIMGAGLKISCEVLFTQSPDRCEDVGDERSACYKGYATMKKDLAVCEKLDSSNNPSQKYKCYLSVATVTNDSKICDRIITDDMGANNYEKYSCLAITKNEKSICENAVSEIYGTNDVDACYLYIARTQNSSKICEYIKDPYQKQFCKTKTVIVNPSLLNQ